MSREEDLLKSPFGEDFLRMISLLIAYSQTTIGLKLLETLGFVPKTAPSAQSLIDWAKRNGLIWKISHKQGGKDVNNLYRSHWLRGQKNKCPRDSREALSGSSVGETLTKLRQEQNAYIPALQWLATQPFIILSADPICLLPSDCPIQCGQEDFVEAMEDLACITAAYRDSIDWSVVYQVITWRVEEILKDVCLPNFVPMGKKLDRAVAADIIAQAIYGMEHFLVGWQTLRRIFLAPRFYREALEWVEKRDTVTVAKKANGSDFLREFPFKEPILRGIFFRELFEVGVLNTAREDELSATYQVDREGIEEIIEVVRHPSSLCEFLSRPKWRVPGWKKMSKAESYRHKPYGQLREQSNGNEETDDEIDGSDESARLEYPELPEYPDAVGSEEDLLEIDETALRAPQKEARASQVEELLRQLAEEGGQTMPNPEISATCREVILEAVAECAKSDGWSLTSAVVRKLRESGGEEFEVSFTLIGQMVRAVADNGDLEKKADGNDPCFSLRIRQEEPARLLRLPDKAIMGLEERAQLLWDNLPGKLCAHKGMRMDNPPYREAGYCRPEPCREFLFLCVKSGLMALIGEEDAGTVSWVHSPYLTSEELEAGNRKRAYAARKRGESPSVEEMKAARADAIRVLRAEFPEEAAGPDEGEETDEPEEPVEIEEDLDDDRGEDDEEEEQPKPSPRPRSETAAPKHPPAEPETVLPAEDICVGQPISPPLPLEENGASEEEGGDDEMATFDPVEMERRRLECAKEVLKQAGEGGWAEDRSVCDAVGERDGRKPFHVARSLQSASGEDGWFEMDGEIHHRRYRLTELGKTKLREAGLLQEDSAPASVVLSPVKRMNPILRLAMLLTNLPGEGWEKSFRISVGTVKAAGLGTENSLYQFLHKLEAMGFVRLKADGEWICLKDPREPEKTPPDMGEEAPAPATPTPSSTPEPEVLAGFDESGACLPREVQPGESPPFEAGPGRTFEEVFPPAPEEPGSPELLAPSEPAPARPEEVPWVRQATPPEIKPESHPGPEEEVFDLEHLRREEQRLTAINEVRAALQGLPTEDRDKVVRTALFSLRA